MIEYQLKDKDGNIYSLNGKLVDRSLKNSVTQGGDMFTFDNKIIERSFLPGSSKIGTSRITSRQLSILLNRANTSDEQFKLEANELLYWLSKSKYLVERAKEHNETDLISSYKLDGTPEDASGNNNDAVLVDPEYINGVSNKALTFPDHTSRMIVNNIDFETALSICVWFKTGIDTGLYQTILDQSDSENIGIQAFINPVTGHLSVYGLGLNYVSEKNYIDGLVHFIIISYDNYSTVSLRVDGPIVQEADISNTFINNTYIFGQNEEGFYEMDKSFIGQEYENLVLDPTDLTAGNWAGNLSTPVISTLSINGNFFTKVPSDGAAAGSVKQEWTTDFTTLDPIFSVIVKKGDTTGNQVYVQIYNITTSGSIFLLTLDWDNFGSSPGSVSGGTLLDYTWIDSETIKLYFSATLDAITNDLRLNLFASTSAVEDEFTYYTEVELVDNDEIMFPFVDGTHSADVIDETFTMPDKFIIRLKVEPRFAFDVSSLRMFLKWNVSATQDWRMYYDPNDHIYIEFRDGGVYKSLISNQFGDGHTNLNQKIDIIIFINLSSGIASDSMFIIIPQESGDIFTDNSFNGAPDIKSSTFPTLHIGYNGTDEQADSDYELLQVFEWDGNKPIITSSEDVDDYLETVGLPLFAREFKDNNEDDTEYADGHQLDGFVDEVKFYNKKLNVAEADILYKHPGNNDRQLEIVIEDAEISYDPGSLKQSSDDNFNLLALKPYWEDVDGDVISGSAIADTIKSQSIFNEGYLTAYPIITLVATIPTPDILITLDSDSSGIQIQDSAFGTEGNLTMVIDCETGIVSINDINRNVNIVEGTGFFGIPVGEDNIDILSDENITYTIELKKRYFI